MAFALPGPAHRAGLCHLRVLSGAHGSASRRNHQRGRGNGRHRRERSGWWSADRAESCDSGYGWGLGRYCEFDLSGTGRAAAHPWHATARSSLHPGDLDCDARISRPVRVKMAASSSTSRAERGGLASGPCSRGRRRFGSVGPALRGRVDGLPGLRRSSYPSGVAKARSGLLQDIGRAQLSWRRPALGRLLRL